MDNEVSDYPPLLCTKDRYSFSLGNFGLPNKIICYDNFANPKDVLGSE